MEKKDDEDEGDENEYWLAWHLSDGMFAPFQFPFRVNAVMDLQQTHMHG